MRIISIKKKSRFLTVVILFLFIGMSIVSSSGNLISKETINRGVTISFSPDEPNGENGWYVSSVTVQFNADSGTIIESIAVSVDGGPLQTIPNNFEIYIEGEHTYNFRAIDTEGNTYSFGPYKIKIDTLSPLVDLTFKICGNIFTGRYVLFTVWCEEPGSEGYSGISHVEFYINDTVQKVDDTPPYTWILSWPYPPPMSFLKVVAYDNAGNSESDELSYTTIKAKMYIIGFIRNLEFSDGYLKFHADFVITFNYFGIMRNKDIVIELEDYEGVIKDRFINAKIRGYWIPYPKKL